MTHARNDDDGGDATPTPADRRPPSTLIGVTVAAGGVRVVELRLPVAIDSDEFDALNASLLAELSTVDGGRYVLDLAGVEYMGSSMLGLMVNARQRVKSAGGRLVLCGLSAWLVQTLHACSLEKLFVTTATRSEAIQAAAAR